MSGSQKAGLHPHVDTWTDAKGTKGKRGTKGATQLLTKLSSLRVEQFSVDDICVVHAIQRCVRRAFLAGKNEKTGKDYSFRKEWIRRRMEALASVFGIDVLTYAVMSNHIHLILRNRPDVVAQWTDEEVAVRWLRVFPGKRLGRKRRAQKVPPTYSETAQKVPPIYDSAKGATHL